MLGLDIDGDYMAMLFVIFGEVEDKLSLEFSGGICRVGGEEDSRCSFGESVFFLDSVGVGFFEREEEYYIESEGAESDLVLLEDFNNIESLKFLKVNCEERNVTGLENFILKILNML